MPHQLSVARRRSDQDECGPLSVKTKQGLRTQEQVIKSVDRLELNKIKEPLKETATSMIHATTKIDVKMLTSTDFSQPPPDVGRGIL